MYQFMKKILLSIASVVFAMNANAQVESAFINPETVYEGIEETQWVDDKGKDQSGYPIEAGHFLCESENVKMSIAYEEKGKISALAGESDNAKTVTIGGQVYEATKGVTGNSNPTATTTEASTNGFVIQFDVKKDGFIYAICKLSSNKPYYVWEGKAGQGERLVAYSLTMHMLDETTPLGEELNYTLPADADGYFDAQAADADKYADGTVLRWPEKIILGAEAEDVKKNGLGIVKFPVYADAGTYLFHATGSKVTIDGFVFSPTELDMKVNKVGEEPIGEKTYSIIGTINGNWDTDTDMELVNGVYSATIEIAEAGSYEYKIRQDHDWAINWGDNGDGTGVQDGPNFKAELPANSSITITFDPATAAINAYVVGGAIEPADAWKVEGAEGAMEYAGTWAGNWWNLTEDMNADVSGYDYLWIDYDGFEGEIQFGIFYSEWQKTESWGEVWYTDQIILTEAAGVFGLPIEKTKVIEKGVGGVDSEYKGDIYAKHGRQVFTQDRGKASKINIKGIYFGSEAQYNAAKEASAIQGVKTIKNDGAIYNVAGQKVSASYKGLVIKNGKKYIQK
jgi:hypothetical protein